LDWGNEACPECGVILPVGYWDRVSDIIDLAANLDTTKEYMAYTLPLCCDKPYEECSCESPVDWDDTNKIHKGIWDYAYAARSDCWNCVHYDRPTCLPLRGWARVVIRTDESPGDIDGCVEYEKDYIFANWKESV
jgi:hypothetical protein